MYGTLYYIVPADFPHVLTTEESASLVEISANLIAKVTQPPLAGVRPYAFTKMCEAERVVKQLSKLNIATRLFWR